MRLAYAILLPDDVHNFMRRVAADLFDRYGASEASVSIEPHVTLKQPFEGEPVERYEEYLDRLAADTEPFELHMRGFATFEREGVVLVDVEQDARLKALQDRIIGELGLERAMYESGEPRPYHFHGTVATGLQREQLDDAVAGLGERPDFRFPLERLALFAHTAERWIVRRRATVRGNG